MANRGKTCGKGKCVHTKQQHNAAQAVNSPDAYANGEKLASMKQLHAQIAAVSNVLTEFGCFRRQCIVATPRIPLDRIGNQAAWTKTDWTTSRWAAWSHFEVSEAPCRCGVRQNGITVVSGYVSWARSPLSSTSQSCCCAGCANLEL